MVYDPASKQLVVRNAPSENKLDTTECPVCHRPLRDDAGDTNRTESGSGQNTTANFASPEYFRMLHHSLPGSAESSGPSSPRRYLTQTLPAGRATPAYVSPETAFPGSSPALPPTSSGISSTAFSPNYFERFFVEERELGRGGKGVVLLVKHVLDGVSLGHFALKRIPVGDDHEWLEKVLIEVQLLQHLSHQNLVSYRHVWLEDFKISKFGPSVPCAFVLQQFCNKGDLQNYIYRSTKSSTTTEDLKQRIRRQSKHEPEPPKDLIAPRKLQFDEIYSFFKDITSGLNHLHTNGYIHRDLKPSNCLLHDTGDKIRVLVSDFGEVQAEHMARRSTGATGTVSYCAPEVLRIDQSTGTYGNFTAKSDIFSLGMILYFLCFAQLPYRNADTMNEENEDIELLRDEITSWAGLEDQRSAQPDLPDKLYRFLRRLLSLHPNDRPTAEEILNSIRTGVGLDESRNTSPRPHGHVFEGIRNNSRISAADTPPRGSPMPHSGASKHSTAIARPGAPPKLRLPPFKKDQTIMAEEDDIIVHSPSGSLVLHSRHSSPTKLPKSLPFPDRTRRWYVLGSDTLLTTKIVFLLLKILSLSLPCMPLAASPKAALPLLGFGVLDLLFVNGFGIYTSIALGVVHVLVTFALWQVGVLCVPKASVLEAMYL